VFIEAARDIRPGEELAYDYMISREPDDPDDIEAIFACRCGSASCRGTMLLPPAKKRRARAKAKGSKVKGAKAKGAKAKGAKATKGAARTG
jgi:hypothetical protein